jgi:outer membrane biosynthesis protein TonB
VGGALGTGPVRPTRTQTPTKKQKSSSVPRNRNNPKNEINEQERRKRAYISLQTRNSTLKPAAMSMMHQRPQPSSEWRKAVQSGLDGFLDFEGRSLGRDGRIAGDWGSAIGVG